jgi:hypothetical protein
LSASWRVSVRPWVRSLPIPLRLLRAAPVLHVAQSVVTRHRLGGRLPDHRAWNAGLCELYDDEAAIQAHLLSAPFRQMNATTAPWVDAKIVRKLRRTPP